MVLKRIDMKLFSSNALSLAPFKDLQTVEYNNVKDDAVGLENEQQQFEYAIQEWKEEQEAKVDIARIAKAALHKLP